MTTTLHNGDCLEVMRTLPAESVDTVITDPPYGLEFMGKNWDHGVPGVPFWGQALRVSKPGALLLAFGGTRTFHRLTCAIEDAGWEIRDCIMWLYGSGFPKSHDISKAIDKAAGAEREVYRTKPHAPNACAARFGQAECDTYIYSHPATDPAQQWHGYGTGLKPAWEPVVVAMKPLDGTFAQNAERHGVAGLWIDGGRVGAGATEQNPPGRWPANLILDEGAGARLDAQSGDSTSSASPRHNGEFKSVAKGRDLPHTTFGHNDAGGASRFFYCAKASRAERNAGANGDGPNTHPTVKPLKLMRYLARLTKTPTGGTVLDPFMGSGTTGIACALEGRDFIGIEKDAEYIKIAEARIEHAEAEAIGQMEMAL